jgi:hypothetical protein
MKSKEVNPLQVWKDFEDVLAPQLNFLATDRMVYSHLLRHSRLEGKQRLRFSLSWLGGGVGLSTGGARDAVRRLAARGVLGLVERNTQACHVVHVRLPQEVRAVRRAATSAAPRFQNPKARATGPSATRFGAANLEKMDFLQTRELRRSIHEREGGVCFYCLRQLIPSKRCLDHVVPRAQLGRNSYRNLVSCCPDCNSKKGERSAEDFVRELYRQRALSAGELKGRLHALDALAAGKLKPSLRGREVNIRRNA